MNIDIVGRGLYNVQDRNNEIHKIMEAIMKLKKLASLIMILTLSVVGCSAAPVNEVKEENNSKQVTDATISNEANKEEGQEGVTYPITIKHAFGETVIEEKPERVVSISWGNQDVPLALGVVPAGVSQANYGAIEGELLLPWTAEKFTELGVEAPTVFSDTAGLDFEAINDAEPDVILAAYSGITEEEYNILSQIAPVVAYPKEAWQTTWRELIYYNALGMGMAKEGEDLIAELEQFIVDKTAQYPQLEGKTAGFFYFNPSDLGRFYVYLPADPRAAFLTDLGLAFPDSIATLGADNNSFSVELSAENADLLADIDIIVAYGDGKLLEALQADPLLSTIPAIQNGAVALVADGTPLSASANPTALSIPMMLEEYLQILGDSANKVQ